MTTVLKHINAADIPQQWTHHLGVPLHGSFRITIEAEKDDHQTSDMGMAASKAAGLWRSRAHLDTEMGSVRAEFDRTFIY